jgi:hypothetical protein
LEIFQWYYRRFHCAVAFGDVIHCGSPLHWVCSRHSAKCVQFLADLNIESIISGNCVLPIDFHLEFRIETPLNLLMISWARKLIPIAQSAGPDVNLMLEDGWPLLVHIIPSHSITAIACLCRFAVDVKSSPRMDGQQFTSRIRSGRPRFAGF